MKERVEQILSVVEGGHVMGTRLMYSKAVSIRKEAALLPNVR